MKKLLFFVLLILSTTCFSQNYISGSYSYYNGGGTFGTQSMATLEYGKYIKNTGTVGLAMGLTAFTGGRLYTELRPTLIVFERNSFSLSTTIGAGYVFNNPEEILTEYCITTSYTFSNGISLSTFGGVYNFNGRNSSSKFTFVGTGLSYSLKKKNL